MAERSSRNRISGNQRTELGQIALAAAAAEDEVETLGDGFPEGLRSSEGKIGTYLVTQRSWILKATIAAPM